MYLRAKIRRDSMTKEVITLEEMKELAENENGFIKAMWCGKRECEDVIKEEVGVTSRCMPFEQIPFDDVCPICGKKAKYVVLFARAY